MIANSKIKRSRLIDASNGTSHLDPVLAPAASSRLTQSVTPFLQRIAKKRQGPGRRAYTWRPMDAVDIKFDAQGLVPCVMQDAASGEVLTLAYMNEEALGLTLKTREVHFWSRSRERIWHKGAGSGNTQRLLQLRYDCDADALVALVEPAGPACHTGERSCFYRDVEADGAPDPAVHESLASLERTLMARKSERPEGSYTVELLDDPELIGAKVREEADEVARAVAGESDERVAEEAADVLYHLQVALASRDVPLSAPLEVLNRRRK